MLKGLGGYRAICPPPTSASGCGSARVWTAPSPPRSRSRCSCCSSAPAGRRCAGSTPAPRRRLTGSTRSAGADEGGRGRQRRLRRECVPRRAQGDRVGVPNPRRATTRPDLSSRRFRRRTGQPVAHPRGVEPGGANGHGSRYFHQAVFLPRGLAGHPYWGERVAVDSDRGGLDGAPVTPRAHKR